MGREATKAESIILKSHLINNTQIGAKVLHPRTSNKKKKY
jgi:hypothetical protein